MTVRQPNYLLPFYLYLIKIIIRGGATTRPLSCVAVAVATFFYLYLFKNKETGDCFSVICIYLNLKN